MLYKKDFKEIMNIFDNDSITSEQKIDRAVDFVIENGLYEENQAKTIIDGINEWDITKFEELQTIEEFIKNKNRDLQKVLRYLLYKDVEEVIDVIINVFKLNVIMLNGDIFIIK